jgi:hypothetical protein
MFISPRHRESGPSGSSTESIRVYVITAATGFAFQFPVVLGLWLLPRCQQFTPIFNLERR